MAYYTGTLDYKGVPRKALLNSSHNAHRYLIVKYLNFEIRYHIVADREKAFDSCEPGFENLLKSLESYKVNSPNQTTILVIKVVISGI